MPDRSDPMIQALAEHAMNCDWTWCPKCHLLAELVEQQREGVEHGPVPDPDAPPKP